MVIISTRPVATIIQAVSAPSILSASAPRPATLNAADSLPAPQYATTTHFCFAVGLLPQVRDP